MDTTFLIKTALFRQTTEADAKATLGCLGAFSKIFEKGDIIYRAGEPTDNMGLVLSGSVMIESDDIWGNKSILSSAGTGELFAETYACIPHEPLMVNVVASEKSEILFLNATRLLSTCQNFCEHHNRLIQNLLMISAQKNLNLSRRILHTSSKSIRGRLLSYLSEQAKKNGSSFIIPFDRQQLSDYLNVDRSALSNELSKMQRDGLLTYEKNFFVLSSRM